MFIVIAMRMYDVCEKLIDALSSYVSKDDKTRI
jgi:hypothetical protein